MAFKLFTHTDLDGVGCQIVANHVFGARNVNTTHCDYKEVNQKIADFINSGEVNNYFKVFITDISVNEEVAELIEKQGQGKFSLIDHHATALWLNDKYTWAHVDIKWDYKSKIYPDGKLACGTDLFFGFLENFGYINEHMPLNELAAFAEKVRRWDVWDWKNVFGGEEYPKQLNNLVYLVGRKAFVDRWSTNLNLNLSEGEKLVLSIEERRISKYIEEVGKNIFPQVIAGYNAGVVFAESYSSELGNALAEANPQYDFIAIVNAKQRTISYRGVRDDIDLGASVAKLYGGGGHAKACGSQIEHAVFANFIDEQVFYIKD